MRWPYEIDWSATIASIGALVAAGALAWNVFWSRQQLKQAALSRIAETRLKWIDEFRDCVSEYITRILVQVGKNHQDGEAIFDPIEAYRTFRTYHDIMLRLPAGQPHFDGFRQVLYAAVNGIHNKSLDEVYQFAIDLEQSAISVIEAERALAQIELSGGFRP